MCEACWADGQGNDADAADEFVAAGIAWLDLNGPADWRERIDLSILDIDLPAECVLGQVFADKVDNPEYTWKTWRGAEERFYTGYDYAVRVFLRGQFHDDTSGPLGFSAYDDADVSAETMTAAWVRALSNNG